MPIPDPSNIHDHATLIGEGLAYIGLIFSGVLGTAGYRKLRERGNGKSNGESFHTNGKATLRDVVLAIQESGERTRSAIMTDGEKTRTAMMRIPDAVNAAHDKTIAAIERNYDKQLTLCNSNVLRAEKGLDDLKDLRDEIKEIRDRA